MRIDDAHHAIGEDEARARLTQLWLDHKPAVERFVRRRSEADADDVVQQVFVTAWRRVDNIPDEPRAWLLTVARNIMLNQRRSNRRRDALAVRVGGTIKVTTRDDTEQEGTSTELETLRQAWLQLSDAEREVLSLSVWDELSGAEAAQVLGISNAACAKRLGRARQHLRDLLADTGRTSGVRHSGATVERSTNEPEHLTPVAQGRVSTNAQTEPPTPTQEGDNHVPR